MPFYTDLRPPQPPATESAAAKAERERTIERLLTLRHALSTEEGAPPARSFETLLLATWNLREFDASTWGYRLRESYAYIAEIVDRFDLIAIQEVREDLDALERVMRRLGPNWAFIASDASFDCLRHGGAEHFRLLCLIKTTQDWLADESSLAVDDITHG